MNLSSLMSPTKTKSTEPRRPSGASEWINIAAKAGKLACQASREPEGYRMAGRLNRLAQFQFSDLTEREVTDFAEAHVVLAAMGNDPFADYQGGFLLLQIAIAQVSYRLWEDLWNDKHPESFGKAWEGQDFALMSVWRARVRETIADCRLHAVFTMATEEYVAKLIGAGISEEGAQELAEWLADVKYEGTTPST